MEGVSRATAQWRYTLNKAPDCPIIGVHLTKGGQEMPRGKKFTAEQIIGKLREAEVGLAQGKTSPEVVRKLGVTEQRYYRWNREYGGVRTDQAKRIVWMASEYGRYGYRRITALLRAEGWWVNHKRVRE